MKTINIEFNPENADRKIQQINVGSFIYDLQMRPEILKVKEWMQMKKYPKLEDIKGAPLGEWKKRMSTVAVHSVTKIS